MDRMTVKDELRLPSKINPALKPLDEVIIHGMALRVKDRIQSIDELKAGLDEALFQLRGGKKGRAPGEIDYDRDPVLKSVLALVFALAGMIVLVFAELFVQAINYKQENDMTI